MKIGIDIRCLMSPYYSGVAQYTYNLLNNLFKIDKNNQYKLFYNSSQDVTANLPKFDYNNVEFYGFNYPNKLLNSLFLFINYPEIEKLIKGCDAFFLPNLNFCAWQKITTKIITIHDLSFKIFPHFFSLKQRLWHRFIRPKNLISQCSKIIADSQNTKNDLLNYYQLPEQKIKVIYPGIDREIYRKIDVSNFKLQAIKKQYNLPDKFILYLGTIEPRKNITGIIEAFDLFKSQNEQFVDLNLVIVGSKGWKSKKIFQTAENSSFSDQIHFIGYIAEEHKPFFYHLAELFVFPSFYEGFGLPVLEAQACALPVIAGLNSSFPEILKNSALLVNPDNLTEIAQGFTQILTQQDFKQALIAKGLENVERFSWQKCAQETLNYLVT